MLLSITQLAKLLNYSRWGTNRFLNKLFIPTIRKKNKIFIDLSMNHPFIYSINLHYRYPQYKIVYTITDIARLFNKDKKTVLNYCRNMNIPIIGYTKKFVYLYYLKQAVKLMDSTK